MFRVTPVPEDQGARGRRVSFSPGGGEVGLQAEAGEGDAGVPQEAEAGGPVLRAEVGGQRHCESQQDFCPSRIRTWKRTIADSQ